MNNNGVTSKRQLQPVQRVYDHQARDFYLVSSNAGLPFTPADKSRTSGENMMNTLFKLGMLVIMDGDSELSKLVVELTSLKVDTPKTRARDDFYDALRYALMGVPWDFAGVAGEIYEPIEGDKDERSEEQIAFDERRATKFSGDDGNAALDIEREIEEWQDLLEG